MYACMCVCVCVCHTLAHHTHTHAHTQCHTEYRFPYEPYVLAPRFVPRYDVRFFGYGNDKVSALKLLVYESLSY